MKGQTPLQMKEEVQLGKRNLESRKHSHQLEEEMQPKPSHHEGTQRSGTLWMTPPLDRAEMGKPEQLTITDTSKEVDCKDTYILPSFRKALPRPRVRGKAPGIKGAAGGYTVRPLKSHTVHTLRV